VKDRQVVVIASVSGILFLAALFFQPITSSYLNVVLNWAIVLTAITLLVAISNLVITHLRYITVGRRGFLFSLVFITAFAATFVFGIHRGADDIQYLRWIKAIQVPLESALLGLLALVMMSAAIKIFRVRGWSILTVSFGLSALLFLFLNLGFLPIAQNSTLFVVVSALQRLPVVGARGLLIGAALGAVIAALRVLFGQVVENE
jgi:hypothetical protein